MIIWLFVLVAVSQGETYWEPCKVQCDSNFRSIEINQVMELAGVCKRGCDLYTVALISTSQPTSPNSDEQVNVFKDSKRTRTNEQNEILVIVQNYNHENHRNSKSAAIVDHPSQSPTRGIGRKKRLLSNQSSQSRSSSKTTAGPASQPVQDHPSEADKQTTTPKGPKREPFQEESKSKVNAIAKELVSNERASMVKGHVSMKERLEQAKHSCRHACVVAYGGAAEQEACVVGCQLQATTAALKPLEIQNSQLSEPQTVVGMFQKVMFGLASHVGRLVRITWSLGSSEVQNPEDQANNVQGYGSEELTPNAEVPMFIGLRQSYVREAQRRPEVVRLESSHGSSFVNREMFHLSKPMEVETRNIPGIITMIQEEEKTLNAKYHNLNDLMAEEMKQNAEDKDAFNKRQKHNHANDETQLDLLECISMKSGLPRWFIALAIFASALIVLWLCFSLTAPPDDIRVVKTKVNQPLENEYFLEDDNDFDDDDLACSEKDKLLPRAEDVIKIRIENV